MDREEAIRRFEIETGLSIEDLPDGLPIEDFVDEEGYFDWDAILAW